ncbi:hypothetical protein C4Q27_08090 [Pseudomonas sp. SWI36]|nr:hypothetical protein C4Q27_08090 [Pseudomonas sp. SWI36]
MGSDSYNSWSRIQKILFSRVQEDIDATLWKFITGKLCKTESKSTFSSSIDVGVKFFQIFYAGAYTFSLF